MHHKTLNYITSAKASKSLLNWIQFSGPEDKCEIWFIQSLSLHTGLNVFAGSWQAGLVYVVT